jgi:hypothetical protein
MVLNKTNLQKLVLASLSANNTYKLVIKKLIFCLILFSFSAYSKDHITQAIIKSDPELVKQEIKKRMVSNKPISKQEQLYYFDLCHEVIARRRNAVQFPAYVIQQPHYYYYGAQPVPYYYSAQPVYTKAYPGDKDPEISFNCGLRCVLGTLGTIGALLYWFDSIANFQDTYNETTDKLVFASGVISFIALFSAVIEIDAKRRQHQEELYENAIQIKHIIYEIPLG